MKAAIYARVSTVDQEPENQLQELRRYLQARDWTAAEYVDRGVSGAKDRRPAVDQLLTDARRRRFVAEYAIPEYDARILTQSAELAAYFEAATGGAVLRTCKSTGNDVGLPACLAWA